MTPPVRRMPDTLPEGEGLSKKTKNMNTYEINGNKYRLKELTLGVLNAASPLLCAYRQEFYRLTGDNDTSQLNELKNEIDLIQEALNAAESNELPENEINKLSNRLEELTNKLNKAPYSSQQKFIKEMESLALLNVLTDTELLSDVMNGILENENDGTKKINEKHLNSPGSIEFIKQVIADFFLHIPNSSLLPKG